jgi:hypothetical protein
MTLIGEIEVAIWPGRFQVIWFEKISTALITFLARHNYWFCPDV